MSNPTPKQELLTFVKVTAVRVEALANTVERLEEESEAQRYGKAFGYLDLDAALRLDSELHRQMLIVGDCQLALSRAWKAVAEHCRSKVEPK